MRPLQHSGKKSVQFKLKPLTVMVLSLFAQHTYADTLTATQVQAKQKQCEQTTTNNQAKIECKAAAPLTAQLKQFQNEVMVVDASAIQQKLNNIDSILPADNTDITTTSNHSERINVSPDIIRTADATDTSTNNTSTQNLPLGTERKGKDGKPLAGEKIIELQKIQVRAKRFHEIGPLPGLGLTKEEIPGNVQSISAKEIKEAHSLSLTDLLNKKLQSVNVNDYQGNPFQMDVTYRGFTAGPQIGTPQGLSVFLDGIRVNEPFGDVVNWDMIPMNAIAGVDVFPGSNPIFGLNTLGGAFTLKTKDGFTNQGVDAEILAGSYGRKQLQVEGGINNGEFALFGAGNFFLEDGWRKNSPSKVNQAFGKASYRGEKLDLSLSTLLVQTDLVGNGLLPSEMYAQDPTSVYTSPDTTKNKLAQFQLSGAFQVNDNFNITGQAYRRNSKRHQRGADVFTDWDEDAIARRKPAAGEEYACTFTDSNSDGLPDYYVLSVPVADATEAGSAIFSSAFMQDYFTTGVANTSLLEFNKTMPSDYVAYVKYQMSVDSNYYKSSLERDGAEPVYAAPATSYSFGESSSNADYFTGNRAFAFVPANTIDPFSGLQNYYYTLENGVSVKNYMMLIGATNQANCLASKQSSGSISQAAPAFAVVGNDGKRITIDGLYDGGTGWVEGTPTAIFTDNQIDQTVDGASIQFNWNLEHHKFMVGASIDAASASYQNRQRLGMLDANRNAYLAPNEIADQFAAKDIDLANNDFNGTNTTKSIYFSETWSPVDTWHFNASGRYNETQAQNKIATRYGRFVYGAGEFLAYPDEYVLCPNGVCPTGLNYKNPLLKSPLDPAETEKFSYYSFNPSLGATWQAKENLNVYANLAKGTRTPSVIELGCAFDKTPINTGTEQNPYYVPKSLFENRQCTLPSTLSGDPYLKQIKATTYDVGMRGTIGQTAQWNVGAYQTDLKDDIYFINVGSGQGFFDNVGNTRRRGLEAGISGRQDKLSFSLNYGLTDATFQDSFLMISNDNSSSYIKDGYGNVIDVKKGNRMPGVPLHNLNASIGYDITPEWNVSLTSILHSESFVRGNENNKHQPGVTQYVQTFQPDGTVVTVARQPTSNPGTLPGYATFNFQTSYKLAKEWTTTLQVTNLFDKEYFSAGRLGRNAFSPSILGAIGPDGYNHNSGDWLSTNFISPGAPRGIWLSLNWHFEPEKK
jgi:outer membrane receptor protein involved in Fe transport